MVFPQLKYAQSIFLYLHKTILIQRENQLSRKAKSPKSFPIATLILHNSFLIRLYHLHNSFSYNRTMKDRYRLEACTTKQKKCYL